MLPPINPNKLVLIRWRDIVWTKKGVLDEDLDTFCPVFELCGRIKAVKRGLVAIQVEWGTLKDYEDEYDGDAGKEMMVVPVGNVVSVRELKIGKQLYKEPDADGGPKRDGGTDSPGSNKSVKESELQS